MKRITFNLPVQREEILQIRSNKDQLIADIVERTTVENKKLLAKRIAIAYNALKWSETDLYGLLRKADDRSIINYSAFVQWAIKIHKK